MELNEYYKRRRNGESNLDLIAEVATTQGTDNFFNSIIEEDYYEKEARQTQKVGIDAYFASPSLPLILNSLTRDKIYELHKNESIDDLQFAELERACEIRSQYFLSYDDKTPRDEQEFVNATNKLRGLLVTKESLREEIEKRIADMTESGKHPKEKK